MINKINQSIRLMELNYPLISILKHSQSQREMETCVNDFIAKIKKQRRLLAKKYHPDICNNGEEMMKSINAAHDFLTKLKINFTPQRPQTVFYYTYSTYAYDTTTTSTGYF
jgi:hypothetical protein